MLSLRYRWLVPGLIACLSFAIYTAAQGEPDLSEVQIREFLLNAKVIASKNTPKGITSPYRLTLSDGKITHDAAFQAVDIYKSVEQFFDGKRELNFRDSYKYDVAAFELAKLLGIGDMMPVTVVRKWNGKTGALSWWLPVMMDEQKRLEKHIEPPDKEAWNRQMLKKRVFAELVYDTDPNLTNVLISKDWHLWMIDFSRGFRLYNELREPKNLTSPGRCDRLLLDSLRKLDRSQLEKVTRGLLNKAEINGLMARRDKIVALFDDLIAKKGEQEVLY